MSRRLISLSPDLCQLQGDGYDLDIQSGYLLVRDVPYVGADRQVKRGVLVSNLDLAGDVTAQPQDHTMKFVGEFPCDRTGSPLGYLRHGGEQDLGGGLKANFSFSRKKTPPAPYDDYHEKVTAYVAQIEPHAQEIDPNVSARTYPVIVPDDDEPSVFNYIETASSRAGIVAASEKLKLRSVAIVGLGGTGSYVLDQVAKTPVFEIHLFDHDTFLTHNAFRGPGAASLEELRSKPTKVSYWGGKYSAMHRAIIEHPYRVDQTTVHELAEMQFVFLCVDSGTAKMLIVEALEQYGVPFIDVGMGIELRQNQSLAGILRATLSEPTRRDQFRSRVSLADPVGDAEYKDNIQVADLNALNAGLAVVRWKMYYAFYDDYQDALHVTLTLDTNMMLNEDCREAQ